MDRKDLIVTASEAGFGKLLTGDGLPSMWHGTDLGMLERFAGLVATAERESCAKLCEAINLEYRIEAEKGKLKGIRWNRNMWKSRAAGECELAIRKRSN